MIGEFGKDLSVVIVVKPNDDWQAFSTWYSFYKNLPEASIRIVCFKGETTFQFFQWAKRLRVPFSLSDRRFELDDLNKLDIISKMGQRQYLIVEPLVMCLESLNSQWIKLLNSESVIYSERLWVTNPKMASKELDQIVLKDKTIYFSEELCPEAKTENSGSFVTYHKGCGKWINTSKGCPFSSATALVSENMTINEQKIINLWRKMVPLYNATA